MVTPPLKDGTPNKDILLAAALCGVDKVFMCGGAQAVAALAYGTEDIPKVAKTKSKHESNGFTLNVVG